MEIIESLNGSELTVALNGRMDSVTAPQLEDRLSTRFNEIDSLVFDFSKLSYISSAGLRVLLGAQKTMNRKGGKMVVRNVNETVMKVFVITEFTDILTIE
ncbi:MAG: anti-sigma factor antagonist [Clostridiales bacterium]|nr:anti-sigma factor antagonist [Clostridiales bacterium]